MSASLLTVVAPLLLKSDKKMPLTLSLATSCLTLYPLVLKSSTSMSPLWFTDQISNAFSLTNLWLTLLVVAISLKTLLVPYVLTCLGSLLFFSASSWLFVFVAFEASTLPIYYVIVGLGQQPERLQAARFMLLYTVLSSVPLLFVIVSYVVEGKSHLSFTPLSTWDPSSNLIALLFMLAFLVKSPLFCFHSWLPKAHVESPLAGSILLAGVLLKFGANGLYRVSFLFPAFYASLMMKFLFTISLLGALYGAIMCVVSIDSKVVVAYASVSHMNVGISAFFLYKLSSLSGFFLSMISHSFCSSLLFLLVVKCSKLSNSRSQLVNIGAMSSSFVLSTFNLLGWVLNMNIPPNIGFNGELLYLASILCLHALPTVLFLGYVFVSSVYSSLSYGMVSHSPFKVGFKSDELISVMFFTGVFVLGFPPVLLFLFPNLIIYE
nr:NADH dehydrogenase subunit 4 [Antarctophthirus lobodontis]